MKVIFAGPSIFGLKLDLGGIERRRPAEQGDIAQAVADGATAIGLIDGHYRQVGAAWHKEILWALSQGIAIYGAASMGALRAAECAAFGMVPVGEIAWAYCRGDLFDDADVALVNAPAEMDFVPLTEPLVDVRATIASLRALDLLGPDEHAQLLAAATRTFFEDRSVEQMIENAGFTELRGRKLARDYRRHRMSPKANDAMELIDLLRDLPDARSAAAPDWDLSRSPFWERRKLPAAPVAVTLP